ncbi:MAG: FG-GAP-like repeat-containing protein, partial [Holophagales bacterium]|nr:FG-GAP-like repeat-containing protein [Holophagales bacterium]
MPRIPTDPVLVLAASRPAPTVSPAALGLLVPLLLLLAPTSRADDAVGRIEATFHVDANGAAIYRIPFELPPGTRGRQPHLALAYDHQQGNGIEGMGWSLTGLSKIERCSATIAQDGFTCGINYDGHDRFCLDGERLVNVGGGAASHGDCHLDAQSDTYFDASNSAANVYHTERESWRRVSASSDTCGQGPCAFTVTDKQGWTYEYGSPGTGDEDPSGSRVLAYPTEGSDEPLGVRVWALDKVTDRNGNSVAFSYTQNPLGGDDGIPCPVDAGDDSTSDPSSASYDPDTSSAAYPCRIDYTANDSAGLPARRHVVFGFEDRGTDAILTYQGGGEIHTLARLTSVETQVADDRGNLSTAKTYDLTYDDTSDRATWRSRIETIEECGSDGTCYQPATSLGYGSYPSSLSLITTAEQTLRSCSGDISWADFDGDGQVDRICTDVQAGTVSVALSEGTSFRELATQDQKCTGGENPRVDWGDFNGDGKADWLCYAYNEGETGRLQVAVSDGTSLEHLTTYDGEATSCTDDWMWSDFDGDGLIDWVCWQTSGNNAKVYALLSDGTSVHLAEGAAANGRIWSGDLASSCSGLTWTDFDGDGLNDWVCNDTKTGQVWVYLSTGNTLVSATGSDTRALFSQEARCSVTPSWVDVNGDGLSDWVCSDTSSGNSVYLLLSTATDLVSRTGNSDGKVSRNLTCGSGREVAWRDFNADGALDWICSGGGSTSVFLSRFESSDGDVLYTLFPPDGSQDGELTQSSGCEADELDWGDFDGNGLTDWLCSPSGSGEETEVLSSVSGYPDLVESFTDGFGGIYSVDYAPLTRGDVYTEGSGESLLNRQTNGAYPLQNVHSAMYVVAGYGVSDSAGTYDYEYRYTYTDARTDLDGRGWMGFATLSRTDAQLQSVSTTTYLQEFPWNGQPSGTELTGCGAGVDLGCSQGDSGTVGAGDGDQLCAQVEYRASRTAYLCQDLDPTCASSPSTYSPYPGVYQVLPVLERRDVYSYGSYVYSLGKEYRYDTYGNLLLLSDLGYVARDWDSGNTSGGDLYATDDVYTASTYFNETDSDWLVGFRQTRALCSALDSGSCDVEDADIVLKAWKTNYDYPADDADDSNGCLAQDDWAFGGTMDVLCQQRLMNHAGSNGGGDDDQDRGDCAADGTWLATTYGRDAYGNAVTVTDPAGNTTTVGYDSTYQTYPITTLSAPDAQGQQLLTRRGYDPRFGKRVSEIDPNDNLFGWCLDPFGRLTAHQGPDDSGQDLPAEACPASSVTPSSGDLLTLETYAWTSRDGQAVYTTGERNTWAGDDWRRTAHLLDGLGRTEEQDLTGTDSTSTIRVSSDYFTPRLLASRTVPFYVGDTAYPITSCYDSSGRRTRETKPYQADPDADVTETVTTWDYSGDSCAGDEDGGEGDGGGVICEPCGSTDYPTYPAVLATETQAAESDADAWPKVLRRQVYQGRPKLSAVTFSNTEATTCFDHDRLGRPTGLTDPIGAASSAELNSLDHPYAATDADLGARSACYDSAGRTSVRTDALGQSRVYTYDGLNRVIEADFYLTDGTLDQTHAFVFDDDGSGRTNLMGHVSRASVSHPADPGRDSSYAYAYDSYGHTSWRQLTFGDAYTTAFEHDPLGRVRLYTYPDGSTLARAWSSLGFLGSSTLDDAGSDAELRWTYPSYSALGRPLEADTGA